MHPIVVRWRSYGQSKSIGWRCIRIGRFDAQMSRARWHLCLAQLDPKPTRTAMILPSSPLGFIECCASPKTAYRQSTASAEATAFPGEPPRARCKHKKHMDSKASRFAGTARFRDALHQFFNKAARHIGRHARIATDEWTFVQHRLGRMQSRQVGTLKEPPDGDFFSPKQ